jgi:hypothetical protein
MFLDVYEDHNNEFQDLVGRGFNLPNASKSINILDIQKEKRSLKKIDL